MWTKSFLKGNVATLATLWEVAARGLQYKVRWKSKATDGRHINVGELRSLLKAEQLGGQDRQDCRFSIGSDSQVSLGAVCKGRSASPALNRLLRQSLPVHLGYGIYSHSGYVPSAFNPSDDPTRGVDLRESDIVLPDWWIDMSTGNMVKLDDFCMRVRCTRNKQQGIQL